MPHHQQIKWYHHNFGHILGRFKGYFVEDEFVGEMSEAAKAATTEDGKDGVQMQAIG